MMAEVAFGNVGWVFKMRAAKRGVLRCDGSKNIDPVNMCCTRIACLVLRQLRLPGKAAVIGIKEGTQCQLRPALPTVDQCCSSTAGTKL